VKVISGRPAGLWLGVATNGYQRGVVTFDVRYAVEIEREVDGRWMAEVSELPGVMAYGATREAAVASVEALALRVLADRLEHGELQALPLELTFIAA
jgi:predicted RNase H-like HicB family nuclease